MLIKIFEYSIMNYHEKGRKVMKTEKKLPEEDSKEFSNLPTKSSKIRYLAAKGWSRGETAKFMGIRYQHVRNVLITPVKNPRTE